mmetsp:Transcript_59234/g.145411  ORF Transcript_59234/g.145411 Transcript_59234/m.145411 type:complete len:272 (-) Transcript_59234:1744-2559(-)
MQHVTHASLSVAMTGDVSGFSLFSMSSKPMKSTSLSALSRVILCELCHDSFLSKRCAHARIRRPCFVSICTICVKFSGTVSLLHRSWITSGAPLTKMCEPFSLSFRTTTDIRWNCEVKSNLRTMARPCFLSGCNVSASSAAATSIELRLLVEGDSGIALCPSDPKEAGNGGTRIDPTVGLTPGLPGRGMDIPNVCLMMLDVKCGKCWPSGGYTTGGTTESSWSPSGSSRVHSVLSNILRSRGSPTSVPPTLVSPWQVARHCCSTSVEVSTF